MASNMKQRYEVIEVVSDLPSSCKIDLNDLDWKLLDRIAKVRPMDTHRVRETLRNQVVAVAELHGLERLRQWAMGLTPAALDYATHLGFMESAFWQGMTGHVDDPTGLVEFTGLPKTVDDGNHRA